MKFRLLILAFLLLVFPLFSSTLLFSGQAEILGQWQRQLIETDADFRGLCAVNGKVAWVSGTRGTFGRTVDGGKTWRVGVVAGAEKLDFRDVEAFGEETAYLMAAGPGPASRIYKTIDGGKTWGMQFQCTDKMAFLDSMAFWDKDHGIAMGDPVGGKNQLIATEDGGAHWVVLPSDELPLSLPKEGAFAAPAIPLEKVLDPTGAGDTFAGGLTGYLASQKEINLSTLAHGVLEGTILASFTVEDFSLNRLASLTTQDLETRRKELSRLINPHP